MEAIGFSGLDFPICTSFLFRCDGRRMIQEVHHPDGSMSFEAVTVRCGREYCLKRDKEEAVLKKVKEWADNTE